MFKPHIFSKKGTNIEGLFFIIPNMYPWKINIYMHIWTIAEMFFYEV